VLIFTAAAEAEQQRGTGAQPPRDNDSKTHAETLIIMNKCSIL